MSRKKKRMRKAWNWFGDIGRSGLVAAATLLPGRPGAVRRRVNAGLCLFAIKGLVAVLKKAVPERRPDGEDKESFPSEHAAQCVAAAMIIEREYPREVGALAYGLAAAVSLSRVESGKHYPRDVIAGAAIGAAVVWASLRLHAFADDRLGAARLGQA